MRRRPLAKSGKRGRQWLAMAMVPSMATTVHASIATATIGAQNGVNSVVASGKHQPQSKNSQGERYREQREQRIANYETFYGRHTGRRSKPQHQQHEPRRRLEDSTSGCTLCYDGLVVFNSNQASETVQGWTCGSLEEFVARNMGRDETECLEYQTVGATDCDCPTSPLDMDYCALCDLGNGSVELIPDSYLELPIPVTETQPTSGLTCGDLLFVKQNVGAVSCQNLTAYQQYCGCPSRQTPTNSPTESSSPTIPAPTTKPAPSPRAEHPTLGPSTTTNSSTNNRDVNATQHKRPNVDAKVGLDGFECFLCPDRNPPEYQDRKLPYLAPAPSPQSNSIPMNEPARGEVSTCGVLAEQAELLRQSDVCYAYIFPEVALDLQSHCGCSGGKTWDLCSLCLERQPLANPNLSVPGTGGLTCIELQEYLRFITDEFSCNTIAETAREVCCTPLPDCPVCVNPIFNFNENKLYPPLGLKCSELSLVQTLSEGRTTCPEIQETFGWYCECPNAIEPSCSLCGEDLPNPQLAIPSLGPGITCGEVDDYASLRSHEACAEELASWDVDVQAYCGCPGFEAPDDCRIQCPGDLLVHREALVTDSSTGVALYGYLTCGELAKMAPFVNDPDLCAAIQESIRNSCCAPIANDEGESRMGSTGTNESDHLSAPPDDAVYSREFILSPYGANNRYYLSSAANVSSTSSWLAAALLATVGMCCVVLCYIGQVLRTLGISESESEPMMLSQSGELETQLA